MDFNPMQILTIQYECIDFVDPEEGNIDNQ